jgi:hypothetical protein
MPLCHAYHVWAQPCLTGWSRETGNAYTKWLVRAEGSNLLNVDGGLVVETEKEERVARCRLVLWRATRAIRQ